MIRPMIQYENTVQGIFARRVNRFVAEVEVNGEIRETHIKNTGRLEELLVPKARVTLQKCSTPERNTAFDLISVYKPNFKWINVDSLAPNALVKQYLDTTST